RVWVRPALDCMAYVTALLPVAQGVAVFAALTRAADSARAGGDSRSRGQVMADALVTRVTGQAQADDVPVMVNLVMTDAALLGGSDEVARVAKYGPVPSGVARLLTTTGRAWVRRLYVHPSTGELVAMEARARRFPPALAELVRLRDQQCRAPYCDAPIRHIDHVIPVRSGGRTTYRNAQGLCDRHNQVKEEPGFCASVARGDVEFATPTGHRYRSHPPPPLGLGSDLELSPVEARVRRLLHTG
ncbi:MAG: HNH endonuclease signature motif containing protein, partial [Candidatus Lutibacillus vidarii]